MQIEKPENLKTRNGGSRILHCGFVVGSVQIRPCKNAQGQVWGRTVTIYLAPLYRSFYTWAILTKRLYFQAGIEESHDDLWNQTFIMMLPPAPIPRCHCRECRAIRAEDRRAGFDTADNRPHGLRAAPVGVVVTLPTGKVLK